MKKYDIYIFGDLDKCSNKKDRFIGSAYCINLCEYYKYINYSNHINTFSCNFITRKEKLEKLKEYEKR